MRGRAEGAHEEFAADLAALKAHSNLSYQQLARHLDRPVSTIHGWVTGRHLPYARDNADFERLLALLGSHDTHKWMARLTHVRAIGGNNSGLDNPYRGLEPFTESHTGLFFGRQELATRLANVTARALANTDSCPVMVIGASGAGKTSLLRAGLWPDLQAKLDCAVHYLTPGNDPVASLVSAVNTPTASLSSPRHDVVIVDQFEELFAESNTGVVEKFTELLNQLQDRPRTTVVISLRADFFHRAAVIPFLFRGLQDAQIVVGPMTTNEVTDCIVLPARHCGLSVAPDLLAKLITEFAGHIDSGGPSGALPLLSHVLYLLADTTPGSELTLDRYNHIGGLTSALRMSAESALTSLGDDQQPAVRFLFTRLVELGVDALPTRKSIGLDIVEETVDQFDLTAVIDEFAGHRLLTINVDAIAISHEALLSAWPRLVEWIADDRDTLLTIRSVSASTQSWADSGRDTGALLRGSQLEAALGLLNSPLADSRLSIDERHFLDSSRAAEQARRLEKANTLSRQLSAQAVALRELTPSVSAQIALIANQTASTVESRSVLFGASSPLPGSRFLGGPGPTALASSTDGSRAAFSNSVVGSITVLDWSEGVFQRGRQLQPGQPGTVPHALALSCDGRYLAVGGTDHAVSVIDLENDERTVCASNIDGDVRSLVFDASGRQLFAAGHGFGIQRWHVDRSDSRRGPDMALAGVMSQQGDILGLAVDHNTKLLAAAGRDGTVALWDLHDASRPRWIDTATEDGAAATVALTADGSTLVAGYHSGRVRVWSIENRGEVIEVSLDSVPFASWVNWVEFSPSERTMVAASSDGNIRIWETTSWRDLRLDLRHPTVVTCARFRSDRSLITSAEDGTVRIRELPEWTSSSSSASIWSLDFDAGGDRLISSSRTRAAIWSIDGRASLTADQTIHPVSSAGSFSGASCIAPAGDLIAIGTRHGDVLVSLTDKPNTDPVVLPGLTNLVENLDISPDSSMLCGVDQDGNVQIWTIGDDCQVVRAGALKVEAPAMCPAFGLDSTTLAVASESGDVTLFDVTDPQSPGTVARIDTGASFALSVAFHPILPVLAVANADRSVSLWDCTERTDPVLQTRLGGPSGNVMIIAFSPEGDRLAAGVTDGKVWLWDTTDTKQPVQDAVIQSDEHGIYALAFSPDGRYLMGAGPHQRIFSWMINELDAADAICWAKGDSITPAEWAHLVPSLPYRTICGTEQNHDRLTNHEYLEP